MVIVEEKSRLALKMSSFFWSADRQGLEQNRGSLEF